MNNIKILLLCSSRFALPAMREFIYYNQLGAVMIPAHCTDMIQEAGLLLKASDIKVTAVSKEDFEQQALRLIEAHNINMGLVFTFSYIISEKLFAATQKGFYNVHPGPLPSYRGPDPVFYQIKNREKLAAVTIHQVDDGTDTGPIVLQENIRLNSTDTYGMLTAKLSYAGAKLASTLIKILALGFAAPIKPQDERLAKYYPKQQLSELTIDWGTMDATAIIALMNACNPHNKGAAATLNNKIVRLLIGDNYEADGNAVHTPGTIITIDDDKMEIATTNQQVLSISFLYIDEGFVTPAYLRQSGIHSNMVFKEVF